MRDYAMRQKSRKLSQGLDFPSHKDFFLANGTLDKGLFLQSTCAHQNSDPHQERSSQQNHGLYHYDGHNSSPHSYDWPDPSWPCSVCSQSPLKIPEEDTHFPHPATPIPAYKVYSNRCFARHQTLPIPSTQDPNNNPHGNGSQTSRRFKLAHY
jgi:hypothetical protein